MRDNVMKKEPILIYFHSVCKNYIFNHVEQFTKECSALC